MTAVWFNKDLLFLLGEKPDRHKKDFKEYSSMFKLRQDKEFVLKCIYENAIKHVPKRRIREYIYNTINNFMCYERLIDLMPSRDYTLISLGIDYNIEMEKTKKKSLNPKATQLSLF